ncbi:hypothetical protein B0H14DRAFT_2648614 [Mycena olivaceomarginata]|nr:hypothetical protein B0H14DRAFT_2648614 [Mycena olivaceomarginata]
MAAGGAAAEGPDGRGRRTMSWIWMGVDEQRGDVRGGRLGKDATLDGGGPAVKGGDVAPPWRCITRLGGGWSAERQQALRAATRRARQPMRLAKPRFTTTCGFFREVVGPADGSRGPNNEEEENELDPEEADEEDGNDGVDGEEGGEEEQNGEEEEEGSAGGESGGRTTIKYAQQHANTQGGMPGSRQTPQEWNLTVDETRDILPPRIPTVRKYRSSAALRSSGVPTRRIFKPILTNEIRGQREDKASRVLTSIQYKTLRLLLSTTASSILTESISIPAYQRRARLLQRRTADLPLQRCRTRLRERARRVRGGSLSSGVRREEGDMSDSGAGHRIWLLLYFCVTRGGIWTGAGVCDGNGAFPLTLRSVWDGPSRTTFAFGSGFVGVQSAPVVVTAAGPMPGKPSGRIRDQTPRCSPKGGCAERRSSNVLEKAHGEHRQGVSMCEAWEEESQCRRCPPAKRRKRRHTRAQERELARMQLEYEECGGGANTDVVHGVRGAAASPRCLERVIRLGLIGEGYGRVLFEEPCSCGTSHREYHWMRLGGSLEEIETIACECLAIIEESTIIRGPEFRKEKPSSPKAVGPIHEPPAAGSYRTPRQTLLFEEASGIFGSRGGWRCLRCGKDSTGMNVFNRTGSAGQADTGGQFQAGFARVV